MSRSSLLLAMLPLLHHISSTLGQTSTAIDLGVTKLSDTQSVHSDSLTSTSSQLRSATSFSSVLNEPSSTSQPSHSPTEVQSGFAHLTSVPLGMPRQCGLLDLTCPQCDGAHVFDGNGRKYNISCDTYFMSPSGSAAKSKSIFKCMRACDNHPRCLSAVWGPDKSCELNYESSSRRARRKGYIGLQPLSNVTATTSDCSTPRTMPLTTMTTAMKKCHATAIACPACNKKEITGGNGTTYRVLCANKLFSETNYAVQRFVSPDGCMAECENFTSCKGATWWPGGNCNLARGEDVFPQQAAAHIAFQSIDPNYKAPPPQLSAFPTGAFKPLTTTSSTTASPSCSPSQIQCPECDGLSLSDGFNETYRVQCNFQPVCDDITGRVGYTAQNDCMEHCDLDPTCLAAIYNAGHCDLCQGSLEGFMTYSSPDEYVVFVAEPFLNPVKPTVTAGEPPNWSGRSMHSFSTSRSQTRSSTQTSHPVIRETTRTETTQSFSTSTRSSHRITRTTTQTTVPESTSSRKGSTPVMVRATTRTVESASRSTGDIHSVSCPAYNNRVVADPSDSRVYEILCDVSFGAKQSHKLAVSNFAACAASCTERCEGFDFASSTSCTLLTAITTVYPVPGVTAAGVMSLR